MTREQFEDVYKDTSSKQLRDMLYATIEKRANGYKQKLQQQVFQDTSFSYTVKLGNLK